MTRPGPLASLLLLLGACRATPPSSLETAVFTRLKHGITVRESHAPRPEPASAEAARRGQEAFAGACMVCHGLDGHATGVPFAGAMAPPVPDLGSPAVQAYSDRQLKWIIENGLAPSGMPAWRGLLGDEEMWRIVAFLRRLPEAGSLGEPEVYGGGPPGAAPAR
jgi:mono/diheme cytochrome c family protein